MNVGLYVKLIGAGVIAAVLAFAGWRLHHSGYTSGVASQQQTIKLLTNERDLARAQVAADATAFAAVNAVAAKAKADAAEQQQAAAKAFADASKAKAEKTKAEAEFMARLKAATAKPECAVLKEVLCDSALGY